MSLGPGFDVFAGVMIAVAELLGLYVFTRRILLEGRSEHVYMIAFFVLLFFLSLGMYIERANLVLGYITYNGTATVMGENVSGVVRMPILEDNPGKVFYYIDMILSAVFIFVAVMFALFRDVLRAGRVLLEGGG